jgi:outer membrane protein assembly factor BamD
MTTLRLPKAAPFRPAGFVARLALLLALVAAAGAGCAGSKPEFAIPPTATDDPLAQAKADLAGGNALRATDRLSKFLQENPGSIHVDEANYLLGLAYLEQKDRVLAADYFQKVTRDFPQSPLASESSYFLALSYDRLSRPAALDQDWTERAIGSYRVFLARYPQHARAAEAQARITALENRLAQKLYENGALYLRMGRPTAAEVYYQRVLEQYPNSSWACAAGVGLGQTFMKRGRWQEAVTQLERIVDACPDADAAKKGKDLLGEARSELGRLAAVPPPAPADTAGAPDSASAP